MKIRSGDTVYTRADTERETPGTVLQTRKNFREALVKFGPMTIYAVWMETDWLYVANGGGR